MIIFTFETKDFGKIVVDTHSRLVYMSQDDYETVLSSMNEFVDMWGREWKFHLPYTTNKKASLDVWMPRHVGYAI